MPEQRAPISTATAIAATALAVVHTGLLLAVAVTLMQVAPRMLREYQDFNIRVPYATSVLLEIGTAMADFAWGVALVGVTFVAIDVLVFVLLASQRRARVLAWIWAVAVTIGLLAVEGPICYVLFIPHFKLMEGLAR
jgi:type II secretory pathway component PulF